MSFKLLDSKRFNALASHSRTPMASAIGEEIEWYSNDSETVIGIILLDKIDGDYASVVLGKDEGGRFRAIEQEASFPSPDIAREWLKVTIERLTATGQTIFPVGDPRRGPNLFTPVTSSERLHKYFSLLNSDASFIPAKMIINEIMPHFIDIDGNFVEQFQTSGFDSRLWELYLNEYFNEEQLFVDRNNHAPDFIVSKYGKKVAIEAVIVGRKNITATNPTETKKNNDLFEKTVKPTSDAMAIRFGSSLFSKLQKKYWELPHVKGNPLVFAIADFHEDQSMLWSSTALINYLYGVEHSHGYDENGNLIVHTIPIASHKEGSKEIPSGYFSQPDAENISAVLFSASGTISKFNRIGRQSGFGNPTVTMIRTGTFHDHNPNASVPLPFQYVVDETTTETWGEGLSMYHNPNARYPVPVELFPNIAHHYLKDGVVKSDLPAFYPYGSLTLNIKMVSSSFWAKLKSFFSKWFLP